MLRPPRLMLLEFNELCPTLLAEFINQGQLPNFQRLHDSSAVFVTDAGEEHPNLEPWIQWPTVHTGLSFAEHKAFHLGDGRRMQAKGVAQILSQQGIRVGVFGSMNLNYRDLNGYHLPDAWDPQGVTQPAGLQPFFDLIAKQVQGSSGSDGLSKGEQLRFALCALRNGLSWPTIRGLVRQLADERRDAELKWRRPSMLDAIQYDVFRNLNRRFDVRFATMFCNSTAHYQHYYWRNMDPERFTLAPDASDHATLREAIVFGYKCMDQLVGRFLKDYPEAILMLCTALSQQPWTDTTKCTFRPNTFEQFLEFAGISARSVDVKPVMAEEFQLLCKDEAAADSTAKSLKGLYLDNEPLMKVEKSGDALFCGCRLTDPVAADRKIENRESGQWQSFAELFHMVHAMRSGRHHPDGVLWVRTGEHYVADAKVSLADIAPTILAHFDIPQPDSMGGRPLPLSLNAQLRASAEQIA